MRFSSVISEKAIFLCQFIYPAERNWTRNCEFAFPVEVLTHIRALVPGNVKGEIREVGT